MKIILTRHGETEENKLGIMQGQLPGKLSSKGIKQSQQLAYRLKYEKINSIYSSDLTRAIDTTNEISKYHLNIPIRYVKSLRERQLGIFQGKKESDFFSKGNDYKSIFVEPKNGESMKKLYSRAKRFINYIFLKHNSETVLIVAHSVIIKAIVAVLMGKKFNDIWDLTDYSNASITIFNIDKNKNYKILLNNDIKHLSSYIQNK